MTSIAHRIATLFRTKANKALDRAEDPREVLDYSYAQQQELLQKVRRGVRTWPPAALSALLDAVRSLGTPLPDATITPSCPTRTPASQRYANCSPTRA